METKPVFCLFIGHQRSGHSIVGALLDAHPEMVVSHELHAMKRVKAGCDRKKLFAEILALSSKQAKEGRRQGKYSYAVPNQWQGRFRKIKVIGDKKGDATTNMLTGDLPFLERFQEVVDLPIKVVYVTRNPFDNIGAVMRYTNRSPDGDGMRTTIDFFFDQAKTNAAMIKRFGGDAIHVEHEDFVSHPTAVLKKLCGFLGVKSTDDYLKDCASIVNEKPNQSRHEIEWSRENVDFVLEQSAKYRCLQGYGRF